MIEPAVIRRSVQERGLIGDLFSADANLPKPTVIVLGGSEGGKSWSDNPYQAEMLANLIEAGFAVFSLAYFGLDGLPPALVRIPLEYFETAFAWLAEQPQVIPNTYALVGGSKGGELALLLGSRYPQIKAVAAFAPASVVFQGLSKDSKSVSSWTHQGKELAFVPFPLTAIFAILKGIRSGHFLDAYTLALRNKKAVAPAAIPAENSSGPILLLSGSWDEMWPAAAMCEQIMARLSAAKFPFSYEHLALETGHNVFDDKTAWPEIIRFLTQEFLPNAPSSSAVCGL